jgi:hypothetical protein
MMLAGDAQTAVADDRGSEQSEQNIRHIRPLPMER